MSKAKSPAVRLVDVIDRIFTYMSFGQENPKNEVYEVSQADFLHLLDMDGQIAGLRAIVAGGRIPFASWFVPEAEKSRRRFTPNLGIEYSLGRNGMLVYRHGDWPIRLRALKAGVQIIVDDERAQDSPRNRESSKSARNGARDKWIYEQRIKTGNRQLADKEILAKLKKLAQKRGWDSMESVQGMRRAGDKYATRNNLPLPPKRR